MPEQIERQNQVQDSPDESDKQNAAVKSKVLQARRPQVIIAPPNSATIDSTAIKAVLEGTSPHDRKELMASLIKVVQETNPDIIELLTDRQLRRWGAIGAAILALLSIVGILLLGYIGTASIPVLIGLVALAALALGIGGAIVTGQKVTVKEATQGTAEIVRAFQGADHPEQKEEE